MRASLTGYGCARKPHPGSLYPLFLTNQQQTPENFPILPSRLFRLYPTSQHFLVEETGVTETWGSVQRPTSTNQLQHMKAGNTKLISRFSPSNSFKHDQCTTNINTKKCIPATREEEKESTEQTPFLPKPPLHPSPSNQDRANSPCPQTLIAFQALTVDGTAGTEQQPTRPQVNCAGCDALALEKEKSMNIICRWCVGLLMLACLVILAVIIVIMEYNLRMKKMELKGGADVVQETN